MEDPSVVLLKLWHTNNAFVCVVTGNQRDKERKFTEKKINETNKQTNNRQKKEGKICLLWRARPRTVHVTTDTRMCYKRLAWIQISVYISIVRSLFSVIVTLKFIQ